MNKLTTSVPVLTLVAVVAVSAYLWTVSGELKALGTKVEQQTMLINRALGKELLVQVPPDVEGAIKEVEEQLREQSRWPTTGAAVQQLNDRLANSLNSLPPWAQEELLPRLLPRRWEINALWILTNDPPKDLDGLTNYVRTAEAQVSSKPAGSSDEITRRLVARRQDAEKTLTAAERSAAIEAASRAIKDSKDLDAAYRLVAAYDDDEAKKLAVQLNQVLLSRTIREAIEGLQAQVKSHEALSDATLRAFAIARAHQAAMDLRLRARSSSLTDAALEAKLDELEQTIAADLADANKTLQARDAEKSRRYQVWALEQIRQVRTYKAIEAIEIAKIPNTLDRMNPASSSHKQARKTAMETLRKEMIERLAPIDQRMLDEAVSQWFRKVYQQRFVALDEEEQLAVVTGFATTVKKLPD